MMEQAIERLEYLCNVIPKLLENIPEAEFTSKTTPDKWSRKEILGHLIDSATNNHQRFVRAVNKVTAQFPTYDQNEWVRIQRYNERPWESLVTLWSACNNHLSHVIEYIPEVAESSPCNIGNEDPVPLDFVIKDYLRHLRHHLKDILGEQA